MTAASQISIEFQDLANDGAAKALADGLREVGLQSVSVDKLKSWFGSVTAVTAQLVPAVSIVELGRMIVDQSAASGLPVQVNVEGKKITVPGRYVSRDALKRAQEQLADAILAPSSRERVRLSIGMDDIEPIEPWPQRSRNM